MKQTTSFKKIFSAFESKTGMNNIRYVFEGHRLRKDQTPGEVGMENEDVIDAFHEQTGGHNFLNHSY